MTWRISREDRQSRNRYTVSSIDLPSMDWTVSSMSPSSLSGACACGACTYKSTSPPLHLDVCYCLTCQRLSGAPFMVWTGITKASLTWQGPIRIFQSSSVATRSFCSTCGSSLALQYDCYPDKTHVTALTVGKSDWQMPEVGIHIFVKSKPEWYQVPADGVERWEEFDAGFAANFPDVVEKLRSSCKVAID